MSIARALVLVALLAVFALALWWRTQPVEVPEESLHLAFVAAASQLGVVGYRDPVGAIESSGARLAYSEGRRLRIVPVDGGASQQTAEAEGQIRHVAWIGATGEVLVEDTGSPRRWWIFTPDSTRKRPLWEGRETIEAASGNGATASARVSALRQIAIAPDGASLAAVVDGREGQELWRVAMDGSRAEVQRFATRLAWPAWTSSTEVACVMTRDGQPRLTVPCGGEPMRLTPDLDVIGPLAFTPDGTWVYFASPNSAGMVDLWMAERKTRRARRLSSFARDSYAPSLSAATGDVVFKTQSYRTHVAEIDLASNAMKQLTAFQAETPFYDSSGKRLSITYGTWRRVMDDAKYPDIAQEIGVIPSWPDGPPALKPSEIVAASDSEDQAMAWSPNGRWIALHSHREQSDDIWLRPSDGTTPDRQITFLGRGAEVGWPRWSYTGTMVLLDGARPSDGRSTLYVVGVDQQSGKVTNELREIAVDGFAGDITHGEWLPDGRTVVAIAKDGPGRHVILEVPITGGAARIVHRFASEHDFPGLAASPDGREVAFVAPANDGFFQLFRLSLTDGTISRVTTDPSNKTQPAWSPDGRRIAFTVWSYDAQFWALR